MENQKNLKASFLRDIKELEEKHHCDEIDVFHNALAEHMIDRIAEIATREVNRQLGTSQALREKFQREVIISMCQGSALSNRDLGHVSKEVWEASGSMSRSMYPPSASESKAASDRTKG